jgi:hypothetical protein
VAAGAGRVVGVLTICRGTSEIKPGERYRDAAGMPRR